MKRYASWSKLISLFGFLNSVLLKLGVAVLINCFIFHTHDLCVLMSCHLKSDSLNFWFTTISFLSPLLGLTNPIKKSITIHLNRKTYKKERKNHRRRIDAIKFRRKIYNKNHCLIMGNWHGWIQMNQINSSNLKSMECEVIRACASLLAIIKLVIVIEAVIELKAQMLCDFVWLC